MKRLNEGRRAAGLFISKGSKAWNRTDFNLRFDGVLLRFLLGEEVIG